MWEDFLRHAQAVYGSELGGAGNTPETPAGRLEDAMRWTSTPELSSYPGELKQVIVKGKKVTKLRPSLKPSTAKDVERQAALPSSRRVTEATVAERAQREARSLEVAEEAEAAGDEMLAAARRNQAARQVPPARPHAYTHWGADAAVREREGIFREATGREPGYSVLRSEDGRAVREDPVARAWLRYDELEYQRKPGLRLDDGVYLKMDGKERRVMGAGPTPGQKGC